MLKTLVHAVQTPALCGASIQINTQHATMFTQKYFATLWQEYSPKFFLQKISIRWLYPWKTRLICPLPIAAGRRIMLCLYQRIFSVPLELPNVLVLATSPFWCFLFDKRLHLLSCDEEERTLCLDFQKFLWVWNSQKLNMSTLYGGENAGIRSPQETLSLLVVRIIIQIFVMVQWQYATDVIKLSKFFAGALSVNVLSVLRIQ